MYRRPANKDTRCQRWQRVSGRLRCAAFKHPRRAFAPGFKPGHVPANRGRRCVKFQKVFGPWFNHRVVRCKTYGAGGGRFRPRPIRPSRGPLRLPPGPRMALPPAPPAAGWRAVSAPMRPYRAGEGYIPYFAMPALERLRAGRTPR